MRAPSKQVNRRNHSSKATAMDMGADGTSDTHRCRYTRAQGRPTAIDRTCRSSGLPHRASTRIDLLFPHPRGHARNVHGPGLISDSITVLACAWSMARMGSRVQPPPNPTSPPKPIPASCTRRAGSGQLRTLLFADRLDSIGSPPWQCHIARGLARGRRSAIPHAMTLSEPCPASCSAHRV